MTVAEREKLLDEGWMLIEKHMSNVGHVPNEDGKGGTHMKFVPQIRAMYQQRRKFYVLEKNFKTFEAMEKRFNYLLTLPMYKEHNYKGI
jgi:hypothetical protein